MEQNVKISVSPIKAKIVTAVQETMTFAETRATSRKEVFFTSAHNLFHSLLTELPTVDTLHVATNVFACTTGDAKYETIRRHLCEDDEPSCGLCTQRKRNTCDGHQAADGVARVEEEHLPSRTSYQSSSRRHDNMRQHVMQAITV